MERIKSQASGNLKFGTLLAGSILFLIVTVIFKPFAIVNAGERGVVLQFGKVQDGVLDEGIHPILPIITSVKRLSVRVQQNSFTADAASKDLQKVSTQLAVNWHIDAAQVNKVFQRVGDRIGNPYQYYYSSSFGSFKGSNSQKNSRGNYY